MFIIFSMFTCLAFCIQLHIIKLLLATSNCLIVESYYFVSQGNLCNIEFHFMTNDKSGFQFQIVILLKYQTQTNSRPLLKTMLDKVTQSSMPTFLSFKYCLKLSYAQIGLMGRISFKATYILLLMSLFIVDNIFDNII